MIMNIDFSQIKANSAALKKANRNKAIIFSLNNNTKPKSLLHIPTKKEIEMEESVGKKIFENKYRKDVPLSYSDKLQFPNGYYVKIVRKEDILKTIDENIIDKEVAWAVLDNMSFDIADGISNGRWTNIPRIGTVRVDPYKAAYNRAKKLCKDAKDVLPKDEYVSFRKIANREAAIKVKKERVNKWIANQFAAKNRELFLLAKKRQGAAYANAKMYCLSLCTVNNNEIIEEDINDGELE